MATQPKFRRSGIHHFRNQRGYNREWMRRQRDFVNIAARLADFYLASRFPSFREFMAKSRSRYVCLVKGRKIR